MSWADRILEVLSDGSRSPAGDTWELSYRGVSDGSTRFALSRVHQNAESEQVTLRARVAMGRRVGVATTSDMRPEGVRAVLRRAYQVARSCPDDESFPGFAGARAGSRPDARPLYARSTAEATAADRAEAVNVILKRLAGDALEAAGLVSTRTDRVAIINSAGLSDSFRATTACVRVFALEDSGASGYAGAVHRDFERLDAAAIASTAARKAVRGRDPVTIPPGDYDVVLEPTAVSEILEWMSFGSFGARSMEDGSSFLAGRRGDRVTGGDVTLRTTDWQAPLGAPAELFDAEGVERRAVTILDGGVACDAVHDRRTAARASTEREPVESTGHAPSDGSTDPFVSHLEMEGGKDTFSGLVSRVGRGLWITRFHYVNGLLDTRRARMTGMTRDGTFLIEDGRVRRGVSNLRFTDSFLEALERIDGVTFDRRVVPTWWAGGGAHIVPGILVRGLHFSG